MLIGIIERPGCLVFREDSRAERDRLSKERLARYVMKGEARNNVYF